VYCDFCGELCDFDFEHLDEQPTGDGAWKTQQERATRQMTQTPTAASSRARSRAAPAASCASTAATASIS